MDFEDRSVVKSEARTGLRSGLRGIFFGWWTVLACNLMTVWGHSLYVYGYGVFLKPLAKEFDWTRAMTAGAGSLGRIEGGIEGPFGGMATDKYGPRIVCFAGSFLAGLGLMLMSLVNSVFSFYGIWLLTSTGFNLGLGGPLYTAVSKWFVKKRGLAQSLTAAGFSVGGSIMPMIMTHLLFRFGWRGMFVRAGLISWAILLPLSWFFIKPHRPEYYGLLPDGAKVEDGIDTDSMLKAGEAYAHEVGEVEFTARQAYRTSSFWMLTLAFTIRTMVTSVVNVHTIPLLTDLGWDPLVAAVGLGLLVGIALPGRIISGVLCDKLSKEKIRYIFMAGLFGILVAFLILLNAGTNMNMLYVYLIVYGVVGLGFPAVSQQTIRGRYFGRKAYSTIDGTISLICAIASIIAPVYAGWIYDISGSYESAFITLCIFIIAGIAVTFLAKPPRLPKK